MEQKLDLILSKLENLKTEVGGLRKGQESLREEVSGLREGQGVITGRLEKLEEGQTAIWHSQKELWEGQMKMRARQKKMQETIETISHTVNSFSGELDGLDKRVEKIELAG